MDTNVSATPFELPPPVGPLPLPLPPPLALHAPALLHEVPHVEDVQQKPPWQFHDPRPPVPPHMALLEHFSPALPRVARHVERELPEVQTQLPVEPVPVGHVAGL